MAGPHAVLRPLWNVCLFLVLVAVYAVALPAGAVGRSVLWVWRGVGRCWRRFTGRFRTADRVSSRP